MLGATRWDRLKTNDKPYQSNQDKQAGLTMNHSHKFTVYQKFQVSRSAIHSLRLMINGATLHRNYLRRKDEIKYSVLIYSRHLRTCYCPPLLVPLVLHRLLPLPHLSHQTPSLMTPPATKRCASPPRPALSSRLPFPWMTPPVYGLRSITRGAWGH